MRRCPARLDLVLMEATLLSIFEIAYCNDPGLSSERLNSALAMRAERRAASDCVHL